jgi:hypothetical protein
MYVEPENLTTDPIYQWDLLGEVDHLSPPFPRVQYDAYLTGYGPGFILLPGTDLHGVEGSAELAGAIYVPDATGGTWLWTTDHDDASQFWNELLPDGNSRAALIRFPNSGANPYPPDVYTNVWLESPTGVDLGERYDTKQGVNTDPAEWGPSFENAIDVTFDVPAHRASTWIVDVNFAGGNRANDGKVYARLDASPGGQTDTAYTTYQTLGAGFARPDGNAWEAGEVTSLRLRLWGDTAGSDLARIDSWSATLRREGVIPYYAAFYQRRVVIDPGGGGGPEYTMSHTDIAAAGPTGRRRHARRVIGSRANGVTLEDDTFAPPPPPAT